MTPEEMQRAFDFIIERQARFAANMDRLEEERKKDQPRLARVEAAFIRLAELAELQSHRLDSHEREFFALLKEHDEERRQAQLRHEEAIAYLKQILDRLLDERE